MRSGLFAFLRSSPLVLRVSALEVRLELRIRVAPETCEIVGHLQGTIAGRKNLDAHRHPPPGEPKSLSHSVKVLDACGNRRRRIGGVNDFNRAAARELDTLRRIFLHPSLLLPRQP